MRSVASLLYLRFQHTAARRRLDRRRGLAVQSRCFNTQPPEGGWNPTIRPIHITQHVSTHSRPKAAGRRYPCRSDTQTGFDTQPPEGGWPVRVSSPTFHTWRFNTQPPEGGWLRIRRWSSNTRLFQHTAARRRLVVSQDSLFDILPVSTHSRPKAAGRCFQRFQSEIHGFNTQPPEGGWP